VSLQESKALVRSEATGVHALGTFELLGFAARGGG
jgi:hypothetical protein